MNLVKKACTGFIACPRREFLQVEKGFITICFGDLHYKRLAAALVRSFKRFQPGSKFAVITDERDHPLLREFDVFIDHRKEFGSGFAQKIHLNKYSPFDETLFIDSDGLFYKDPEALWDIYRPNGPFGLRGFRYRTPADGIRGLRDPEKTLAALGVDCVPFVNSGIIYFQKQTVAEEVFSTAQKFASDYKKLGVLPFGGSAFGDEIIFELAMAVHDVQMIPWSAGPAMDMYDEVSNFCGLDISKPSAEFTTYGREVDPIFVHYCAGAQHSYIYNREVLRLLALDTTFPFKGVALDVGAYARTQILNLSRRIRKRLHGLHASV